MKIAYTSLVAILLAAIGVCQHNDHAASAKSTEPRCDGLVFNTSGGTKQPAEIDIEELHAPQSTRPDDKFLVRVAVHASRALKGQKAKVHLLAKRTRDRQNKSLAQSWWPRRQVVQFVEKEATFVGQGEFPRFEETFEVDLVRIFQQAEANLVKEFLGVAKIDFSDEKTLTELKRTEQQFMLFALKKSGVDVDKLLKELQRQNTGAAAIQRELKSRFMESFLEGEWEFSARVSKHSSEQFQDAWHVSQPARVLVMDRRPRVLLFAGGPTRDYQFLRTLLAREAQERRLDLSVYLQTGSAKLDGVAPDLPLERLLTHFPHRHGPEIDAKDKFSSIDSYDLIIALDADWSALSANLPADPAKKIGNADQAQLVSNWVAHAAGGIIFVAGPTNTYQLSAQAPALGDLPRMIPVILKDSRTVDLGVDMKRPYPLTFTPQALASDLLRLEPANPDKKEHDGPAGWDRFFWGEARKPAVAGAEPKFGFFMYYPVAGVRDNAMVLARFGGPKETHLKGEEQPWLATMAFGQGKTVYVGSSESWRLRQFRESYHETFWLNLVRFATSSNQQRERFGFFVAPRTAQVGTVPLEVQIKQADRIRIANDERHVPGEWHPKDGPVQQKVYVRKRGQVNDGEPFDLRPKAHDGPWQGWFEGKMEIKEEGDYELVVKIYFLKDRNNVAVAETLIHPLRVGRGRRD